MALGHEPRRFHGGVHPEGHKELTSASPIQTAPLLGRYYVILQQHIGAPPNLVVKDKDVVRKGQLLAEPGGFVSASVHAPTSGVVKLLDWHSASGVNLPAVQIDADGADEWVSGLEPCPGWESLGPDGLRGKIAAAGVVGMGGAAFPTAVKLSPPPSKKIDVVILNGAECEPYLTADHRLMLESPEKILLGAAIIARTVGAKQVFLAIEGNKPDAIATLEALAGRFGVVVVALPAMYPQGVEKHLIFSVTGRKVPTGALPMDVGCVVQNVGTALAVAEAVAEGKPLIERVTTITGSTVVRPGNWRLRIGTTLADALTLAGGVKEQPAKLLLGGPMMGQAQTSLDTPVSKNSSGILLLSKDEVAQYGSQACIRCGRCVDVCPMSLMPGPLSVMIESERFELADYAHAAACVECGCCAYVCPSRRPLVQHLRRGKAEINAKRKKGK